MKKLIAILLLLVLVTSFVACGDTADGVPEGMKNAAVENAAFYLYVPELWLAQTQGGVSGALSPKGNANVVATAYLPDTYQTPKSYWEEKCLNEYTAAFTEFTVLETSETATLGGINAYKTVFTHKMGDLVYKQMQLIAVDGGMVYTVQYTAVAGEAYDEWVKDFESICANFTLR